jgi:hypothetical protein
VSVLDAGSGTVRRTIPLGKGLSMMPLDDRAGRVFVVSDAGSAPAPDTWGWLPAWLRRRLSFLPPLQPRPRIVPPSVTVLDSSH